MLTVVWIIFEPVKKTATITFAMKRPEEKIIHPAEFNVGFIVVL